MNKKSKQDLEEQRSKHLIIKSVNPQLTEENRIKPFNKTVAFNFNKKEKLSTLDQAPGGVHFSLLFLRKLGVAILGGVFLGLLLKLLNKFASFIYWVWGR